MKWRLLQMDEEHEATSGLASLRARPRAVLELLLVEANRSITTERIIDQLWPEDPPRAARNSVQRFVADIRIAMGGDREALVTTESGYRLVVNPDDLDVAEVRRLRTEAGRVRHADPTHSRALLERALSYFGDLSANPPLTFAAAASRAANDELRLDLLDEWIEAGLASGGGAGLIGELVQLTREHPYNERFCAQLMTALSADGRRVEALRAFEELRSRLAEDIGIGPSVELRELELKILADSDRFVELAPGQGPITPPTDLVGREVEIVNVRGLLGEQQLVTVVGPGGVGKTRLVVEVARRSAESTGMQSVLVRLAEAGDDQQVPDVVAAALGLQLEAADASGTLEEIFDYLARSPCLLVLDNAEHVLDAVAAVVEGATADTQSRFLVSSRQRLGVSNEWTVSLAPLSVPADHVAGGSDSERLFRMRASAVGAVLAEQDECVAAICDALDGLPLAIELAASQLAHVGVRDLLERLDSRRLGMSGSPGRQTRHSTLAAMMAWSWDLLSPDEVALLEQLAVFNGPVDAATVEGVVGEGAFTTLSSLVGRSLVTSTVTDGRGRFSLLETVRLYATERAAEAGTIVARRDAHADYLLGYLRQWSMPELNAWLDVIDEIEAYWLEYSPALEWLDESSRHGELIELATRTTGLWARRGPGSDLARWSTRLSELAPAMDLDHQTQAAVLVTAAEERFRFGDYGGMVEYGEQLVELEDLEATDLGTPFLAFYNTALHTFSLDTLSRQRVELAHRRAPHTSSAELNRAQTEMWLGCCQLMDRQFGQALNSFSSVLTGPARRSGVVMWAELGRVAALHLLDRPAEALAALGLVGSDSDDSIWSYAIDVVRATVLAAGRDGAGSSGAGGGSGGVDLDATRYLVAAARRRIREQRVASRDDFQIGFGLVAAYGGRHDLSAQLLADPMPQSPVMSALLFNHLHPQAMSSEEWRAVWETELVTRLTSVMHRSEGEVASVDTELARWAPDLDHAGPSPAQPERQND